MVPVVCLRQPDVTQSTSRGVVTMSPAPLQVELLSWKSNKDLTGDGGIIKTTVREGNGWEHAKNKDEVVGERSPRPGLAIDTQTLHSAACGLLLMCPAMRLGRIAFSHQPAPRHLTAVLRPAQQTACRIDSRMPTVVLSQLHAVKYEVRVKDSGEVVAASPADGASFPLPEPRPLRGFADAVKAMKKGEAARLLVRNSDCKHSGCMSTPLPICRLILCKAWAHCWTGGR
jgi:hypothetical protein